MKETLVLLNESRAPFYCQIQIKKNGVIKNGIIFETREEFDEFFGKLEQFDLDRVVLNAN